MDRPAILAYPFRIFFLLTAVFGAAAIVGWIAMLEGLIQLPPGMPPTWWHAHEMLYGFVPAAIAGFLMTAMPNWTGVAPPKGLWLLALAALWLAGRLAMLAVGWLPLWLVAIIDLAFLPVLAVVGTRMLIIARNRRNIPIIAVLLAMAAGNALMYAAATGWAPSFGRTSQLLGLDLIGLLIAIIGGRITPAFTRNWLNRRGDDGGTVRSWWWLEHGALVSLVVLACIDVAAPGSYWVAATAGLAALIHAVRLAGWQGWRTLPDGLVWILHLGYAWLPLGLALRALAAADAGVTTSAWIHALGAGAMGTMILGVMARVSVAHTGRSLTLRRGGMAIFGLVTLGATLRVAAGFGLDKGALYVAGSAWAAAFALFAIIYGPVLWKPRADGKAG